MTFVNRTEELARLERWWAARPPAQAAVVWGRRRVGMTSLIQHFTVDKPTVFHTGIGRPEAAELAHLAAEVGRTTASTDRDLSRRPYQDWDDALDDLAERSRAGATLLVLDEFPDLVRSSPLLPSTMRAFFDRWRGRTHLRVLVCGSAVRHMQAIQEERSPLYGRFDLTMQVLPFRAHEASLLLPGMSATERALVYGLLGGVPMYLNWWDTSRSARQNIGALVAEPGGRLLIESDLVIRTEVDGGEQAGQVLRAIAAGRTTHSQIKDWVRAEPSRSLERLVEMRFVERLAPAGTTSRTTTTRYRILDPFIRFGLGTIDRYRPEIERGLGTSILPVLMDSLDDHMGDVWESMYRDHLRLLAAAGRLPIESDVVEIGPWWHRSGDHEIDALALAGRGRVPVLAGEAKWARTVKGAPLVSHLREKAAVGVGADPDALVYSVCARSSVTHPPPGTHVVTADDIMG